MNISKDVVAQCRDRGGDRLEDRDDRIGNTLVEDTLGYQEGSCLVGESYSQYPDREDLANPQHGSFLRELLSHELVGSWSDAVKELTGARTEGMLRKWIDSLERASELHGLESQELFANAREPPETRKVISEILGYKIPDSIVETNNVLLLSALYVEGLSISEISDVLETDETSVSDTLKSVGLLAGATTDESEQSFRRQYGEINRPSGGASVNKQAVSESDTVKVVSR
ncbi:hypothetical protein [Halorubrum saccharovorum]|uniref:hypothetical protein n=1 Tax=Halorubrum saccharovorum TaxID=2248 RepID=UPI00126860E7|nr:hypothetical protein [Halorubrum saccharovorum]